MVDMVDLAVGFGDLEPLRGISRFGESATYGVGTRVSTLDGEVTFVLLHKV
jgi:hypothetical protein